MTVKLIDHINLSVRNFTETVEWYRRVFGFELVEEGDQDGEIWGVIRKDDALLCIYEQPGLVQLDRFLAQKKGFHYMAHFGIRIEDRKKWESIIEQENLDILYGGIVRWPHSLAWYVQDPTGWEIEVVLWDDNQVQFGD